jgi:hypothetical protein
MGFFSTTSLRGLEGVLNRGGYRSCDGWVASPLVILLEDLKGSLWSWTGEMGLGLDSLRILILSKLLKRDHAPPIFPVCPRRLRNRFQFTTMLQSGSLEAVQISSSRYIPRYF